MFLSSLISTENDKAPLPRGSIHQTLWFPFRLGPIRNWKLMNPYQVFTPRFGPRLIHTYMWCLLSLLILSITRVIQVLISGMKKMHFLIEYPWNKCTLSVPGPLLKAFSVDVIPSGYYRGDNSLLSLLFNGKDGTSFANISRNITDTCNATKVSSAEEQGSHLSAKINWQTNNILKVPKHQCKNHMVLVGEC